MKIKVIAAIAAICLIIISGFLLITRSDRPEQQVFGMTYDISKEYLSLRLRTDNILVNARDYDSYENWNDAMTTLISDWESLGEKAQTLEKSAANLTETASINFTLVGKVYSYDTKEVTAIIDSAPVGKKIVTLAKHFGVDVKKAHAILNQSQAEITSEVFIEEGNAFETLENQAIVIKDGCKVVGFVGGIAVTGGVAGLAAAGTVAQATAVVVGADLALEITEDAAQIAMGDRNKVSSFVKDVRTVTEPIASVLTITDLPRNLGSKYGNFEAVMAGLEQFRESAQEGKVVGIDLKNFKHQKSFQVIRKTKYPGTVTVAEMEKAEVEQWLEEVNNKKYEPMTQSEMEVFLGLKEEKPTPDTSSNNDTEEKKPEDTINANALPGSGWKGSIVNVSGGDQEKLTNEMSFVLEKGGKVGSLGDSETWAKSWEQSGNLVRLYGEDRSSGYYEFSLSGNSLNLSKIVIGDEEITPGQEYMGGTAPSGTMYRQSTSAKSEEQSTRSAMTIGEFNDLDDDGKFRDIKSVTQALGEPDIKTTDDKGRIVYVYYDVVKYDSGNFGSSKMVFYDEEDYKSYITGAGASWESNKETWDESGGGIRASSEIRNGDTYKKIYGD